MEDKLEQVSAQIADLSKQVASQIADVSNQLSSVETRLEMRVTTAVTDLNAQARINMEELKTEVKLAAEGYGARLEHIERELEDLNKKVDTRFGDHDLVLSNHNKRVTTLEER